MIKSLISVDGCARLGGNAGWVDGIWSHKLIRIGRAAAVHVVVAAAAE